MFLAIVFILIGLLLLLNAMGIIAGNFWGFVWAIFFLAIGIKLMIRKGNCPICGWHYFGGKVHNKIHNKMHDNCGCGCYEDENLEQ